MKMPQLNFRQKSAFMFISVVTILLFCTCVVQCEDSTTDSSAYFVVKKAPHFGLNRLIGFMKEQTEIQCARYCNQKTDCLSFIWDPTNGDCLLGKGKEFRGGFVVPTDQQIIFSRQIQRCSIEKGYEIMNIPGEVKCVRISGEFMNYFDALRRCSEEGGRLLKPNDNRWVEKIYGMALVKNYLTVRIGLDDRFEEGVFVWSDGQVMTESEKTALFGTPEPNNATEDHDCGVLGMYAPIHINSCSAHVYFACEIEFEL